MSNNVNPFVQIRDPDSTLAGLTTALNELQPSDAQWWEYCVSHRRFMLRLYSSGGADDLMIGTFGAKTISGPTDWIAPSLRIEFSEVENGVSKEIQWTVRDKNSPFLLSCENLFWGRNVQWIAASDWCRPEFNTRCTSNRLTIRNYDSSDCAQVVELWDAVFPNSTGHNEPKGAIDRKVASNDGLFFVAADGDVILGTVLAGYDGHRGWLYSVAVAPDRRRDGIGSQLIRHAEQALAQLGCPKLNIQVRADNAAVVAFYESLGFQTEERISMGKLIEE